MTGRLLLSLLGVAAALACGDPRSDAVFQEALPGKDKGTARQVQRPPNAQLDIRAYRGHYRRDGTESRFQPCGTATQLDVTGTNEGRALLAERVRWVSLWQNQPLYGVLRGAVITDTLPTEGDSTATSEVRRRFFVVGVDSLRPWDNDCGGMRVR